jgi:hypothetical protein
MLRACPSKQPLARYVVNFLFAKRIFSVTSIGYGKDQQTRFKGLIDY